MRAFRKSLATDRRPMKRRRDRRRGVAAAEFAIVAPVFLMVVLGIIEVGRAIMVQQVLINASRVGARRAVMLSSTEDAVIDAVSEYTSAVGVATVSTSVSPDPETAEAGAPVTVTASVSFSNVSWLPTPWFMGGKTLTSSSVMRKEGF
jgi:Flp pilus assembly protein TadG